FVEDLQPVGRGEVESEAALATVGVLQQDMDVFGHKGSTARGEAAHGVAPLDVLDLDDIGAPIGEERRRRRHEGVVGHLEDSDALQDRGHDGENTIREYGYDHSSMTDEAVLLTDRVDAVLVLTLNRPEARNALSPALINALSDSLKAAADDGTVRAVVITGAGEKAFCAGMDLRAFAEARDAGNADMGSFDTLTWFHKGGFPKPVVAAVNGPAVAGGFELVLSCDLVVAADHATFGLAEVKRALFPAGGGTTLSARIPLAVAMEMGLTGDAVDAARAQAVGLVNRVVPANQLVDVAVE